MKRLAVLSCIFCFLISCQQDYIPEAPDYSQAGSWYIVEKDAPVDVFYISSTETVDFLAPNGKISHYAEVVDTTKCPGMRREARAVNRRFGGSLNFFAPIYRQITFEAYLEQAFVDQRFPVAMSDIRRAFDYFLTHLNDGRPFILTGFSQGGQAVVELLKEMPEEVHARMVAAYVLGWHITAEELENSPSIIPATGADDTGVTICVNSVRRPEDANAIITGGNVVGINPVNWRIDETPATMQDTLTVTLDRASMLVLVEGYKGTQNIVEPYFGEGDYHTMEVRWYTPYLYENLEHRSRIWLAGQSQ